jgi:hypothetical protein
MPIRVTMSLKGLDRMKAKFPEVVTVTRREGGRLIRTATRDLYDRAKLYLSLQDHTLADLARLGHPYARRFGAHTLHPDYFLHVQTGTLIASLNYEVTETPGSVYGRIGNTAYYHRWLIYGTTKMRPRDYLQKTEDDLGPSIVRAMTSQLSAAIAVQVRKT